MYVHLGGDIVVPIQDIIGIFDTRILEGNDDNHRFLSNAVANKRMMSEIQDRDRKSLVVTTNGVYWSAISSLTLVRRVTNVQWGLSVSDG
ncbi:MAG TPA: extracellular matrix/biofilm biosynthesis regulator RemA family protein [Candidatus Acidoferrales bacterium]|nr:extracellular matrix/biofilm biosynthesis regulator RemA family protein [Candidatus Acidoferrales bacterium]